MIWIKRLIIILFLFLSCEKPDENAIKVIFYTTRSICLIESNFGNFQISRGSKYIPDCSDVEDKNRIEIFHLSPGEYQVKFITIDSGIEGYGKFIVNEDDVCVKLDVGLIYGWE